MLQDFSCLPFEGVPLIALYNPERSVAVLLKVLLRLSQFGVLSDESIFNSVQHTAAKFRPDKMNGARKCLECRV